MRYDLEWVSIPGMFGSAVRRFPEREAIVDGDVRMTYRDFGFAGQRAAFALMRAGVRPGDRIAIWAPNVWEWIVCAVAITGMGGVLVPVNTRFKGREAAFVLGKSKARMLFTVNGFLSNDYVEMLREAGTPDTLERIVVLRGDPPAGTESFDEFLSHGAGIAPDEVEGRAASVLGRDVADIVFTSGTTGEPKGVMTTHDQTLRVFDVWSQTVGLREGDRYLIVNPFFHTFGYKAGILASMMRGATMIPHAVFEPESVMRRIEEERVTVLPGPPTLYHAILDHPERKRYDLSSLRLAVTGAAVVPVSLIERMRDELSFETILTAYGLTECTGTATMCRPGDDPHTIATTSGCAIPDTEVRVVTEDGEPCAPGEPGEVVVRGFNVMAGYLDDPDATVATIRDGWLHTGDVGVMDERGYLRITDRLKDMYIAGGFNVYPAEVEAMLLAHPEVAQAAVVGIPDQRLGEVGCAFVVPRHGSTPDPDGIVAWAREQMANYKAPRRVVVVESLPLNASGKVLKFELRERARSM